MNDHLEIKKRIIFLNIILFFCFCILSTKLLIESFIDKKSFFFPKKEPKSRLEILDRNGMKLAINKTSYNLYIDLSKVINFESNLDKIITIFPDLKDQKKKFLNIADQKKQNGFILIKTNLDLHVKDILLNNGVLGLVFEKTKKRLYKYDNLFSHIVGAVSKDDFGILGIEKSFDSYLINFQNKNPLILSLDYRVQLLTHNLLSEKISQLKAKGGAGVMMSIKTGEIISAVSLPDFNPNTFQNFNENQFNRFSNAIYELGSVFKLFLGASAAEKGLDFKKNYDRKIYKINKFDIHDASNQDFEKYNSLSLENGIAMSSNVICARIVDDIGYKDLYKFYKKIHIFDKLQLDIDESSRPLYSKFQTKISAVTMSYGHGIANNILQYMNSLNILLNNGRIINPTFLKIEENANLNYKSVKFKTKNIKNIVLHLMYLASINSKFKDEFESIGLIRKSGTSEKQIKGIYNENKLNIQMVGVFPYHDPEYMIFFLIDEPSRKVFSGQELSPLMINFVKNFQKL